MSKQTAKIKWFDPDKGYGFLERPNREDIYLHRSDFTEPEDRSKLTGPKQGDLIEFQIGGNDRGPKAVFARIVQRALQKSQ